MTDFISILNKNRNVHVIDSSINNIDFVAIDLSKSNNELLNFDSDDAQQFENYINFFVSKNNAKVAFGGYNEVRSLYKRSEIFNSKDQTERTIHIGLDLWIRAGTPVLAALEGKVHSFKNNLGLGNYGPTIILEHLVDDVPFYTLYGHLSIESISNLKVGVPVLKGEQIATLGDATVNGNYAPHLHFQIIQDIGNYFGDYPGVCSAFELNYYLKNCPNPNVLLQL